MSSVEALQSFTDKWQTQWPESLLLQGFLLPEQRAHAAAWGALLCEIQESVFAIAQDAVRGPKSQWWAEEMQRTAALQARHPLTQQLQDSGAPFSALASPLLVLAPRIPLRTGSTAALQQALQPLTEAFATCEAVLFGSGNTADAPVIAVQLLLMRLPRGLQEFDRAMVPMHLWARHQFQDATNDTLKRDWIDELLALLPQQTAGNAYREAQRRFIRRRLVALRFGKRLGLTPLFAWDAWRAVRRSR